jgi:class 3 adenylate cyclase
MEPRLTTPPATADLAVMFMEIADAHSLYATLGDGHTAAELERRMAIGRTCAQLFAGEVIKSMGKGLLITFSSAEAAMDAAFEMHARAADLTPAQQKVIALRIGIHVGPVVREQGDVFGDTVNVAARILELAAPSQTLAAAATRDLLPDRLRALSRPLGQFSLKGKAEPILIYQFSAHAVDDMTLMTRARAPREAASLDLSHDGRVYRINALRPSLSIGRSADADLVVADPEASRLHAKVELKNDKFVLVDHSTNGTTVKIGDAAEVELHREVAILYAEGAIWCGRSRAAGTAEVIRFKVVT